MSEEIPTPRVDAEAEHASNVDLYISTGKHGYTEAKNAMVVNADLARTLEKETILLQRELDALRKDKERLDWIQQRGQCIFALTQRHIGKPNVKFEINVHLDCVVSSEDVREVIDAAIEKEKETK